MAAVKRGTLEAFFSAKPKSKKPRPTEDVGKRLEPSSDTLLSDKMAKSEDSPTVISRSLSFSTASTPSPASDHSPSPQRELAEALSPSPIKASSMEVTAGLAPVLAAAAEEKTGAPDAGGQQSVQDGQANPLSRTFEVRANASVSTLANDISTELPKAASPAASSPEKAAVQDSVVEEEVVAEPEPFPWVQHENDEGIPFYHNAATGESRWELDDETAAALREHKARVAKAAKAAARKRKASSSGVGNATKRAAVSPEDKARRAEEQLARKAAKEAAKEAARIRREVEKQRANEAKAQERAEREAERLRLKAEKEAREKEAKEKAAAERARLQAERTREKEERKQRKAAERKRVEEERARKKEEEAAAKRAAAKLREAERLRRKEEKEREEEERRRAKEEALKAKKKPVQGMQNFMSRFVVKEKTVSSDAAAARKKDGEAATPHRFGDFYVQKDMTLAPACPVSVDARPSRDAMDRDLADWACRDATAKELLSSLRSRWGGGKRALPSRVPRPSQVLPVPLGDGEPAMGHPPCMKLLQFEEDVRPPYFGTFTKTSKLVTGRRPMGRAPQMDYEYDSEAEWEPEPEDAVNVEMSDVEEEEEEEGGAGAGEEGEEDGWMVPHGYLSDDEGIGGAEALPEGGDGVDPSVLTEEERKQRRAARKEFQEQELARAAEVKSSFTLGCVWGREAMGHACLGKYAIVPMVALPINPVEVEAPPASPATEKKTQRSSVSDELLPELVKLVHGSASGVEKMVEEFCKNIDPSSVTKASLVRKLKDPAFCVKEQRSPFTRQRYFVQPNVLATLNLESLPLPEPALAKEKQASALPDGGEGGAEKAQKRDRPDAIVKALKTAAKKRKRKRVSVTLTEEDKSWTKHIDDTTGLAYYHNSVTEASVWETPKGFTLYIQQQTQEAEDAAAAAAAAKRSDSLGEDVPSPETTLANDTAAAVAVTIE